MENKTEQMQKRLSFDKPKEYQLNVIENHDIKSSKVVFAPM